MKIKPYLPSIQQISQETLAVLAASLLAAFIISRFPAVKAFVNQNSVN